MKTTFDKKDDGYRWETTDSSGNVVGQSETSFSGIPGALDDFYTKHPTLDRNSVQTLFDGTKYILHN